MKRIDFEIGGAINEERALVIEREISLPLRVGKPRLRLARAAASGGRRRPKSGYFASSAATAGSSGTAPVALPMR